MQSLGTKNNVEDKYDNTSLIDSRHDAEEIYIYIFIYIYRSIRESLQDLEVVHSRRKKFFHESLQDLEIIHSRRKKLFQSNYFKLLAIADVVNKFI